MSTMVGNHCSFLDVIVLTKVLKGHLAFVASEHVNNIPGMARSAKTAGCIMMPMGGSDESKAKTTNAIEKRQNEIEGGSAYVPFVIYPEGTCSNNTCILPFRKGAFGALKTIIPVTIKYRWTWF